VKKLILGLCLLSNSLYAKEFFSCDLSVDQKIIRSKTVELLTRNLTIDMGPYNIYHFSGGVSGDYKYAWYYFDEVGAQKVSVEKVENPPVEAIAVSEIGELIKLSCNLVEEN
jgi:hypothetical protein